MRESLLIAVLGILGIAAGAWYLAPVPVRNLFGRSTVVVKDTRPQQPTEEKVVAASRPNAIKRGSAGSTAKSPASPSGMTEGPRTVPPSSPPPASYAATPGPVSFPFPTREGVKIGVEKSQILNEFGMPALSASTEDRGHLYETYVYKRNRSRAIIHLKDARVLDIHLRN